MRLRRANRSPTSPCGACGSSAGSTATSRPSALGRERTSCRNAYLDLLKLSLCDLAGAHTLSVFRVNDVRKFDSLIYHRALSEEETPLRAMGSDWPFGGLTMIGLKRLDDLQRCIESVVADGVEGDVIEAGVWRGGASILARATLDSLGADDRTVWVADSFRGLPPPDSEAFPEDSELDLSQVDYLVAPVEEVRGYFERFGLDRGVEFLEGFFSDTLSQLRGHPWSVIRLDGDTYEAMWVSLEALYPSLSAGGYVVVDDYLLIKEVRAAVDEFREQRGITAPIQGIDWVGARWRKEEEPDPGLRGRGDPDPRAPGLRPDDARTARSYIPSERELELERELKQLRGEAE